VPDEEGVAGLPGGAGLDTPKFYWRDRHGEAISKFPTGKPYGSQYTFSPEVCRAGLIMLLFIIRQQQSPTG
jgi:hypothetical protein